jgi:ATP-dependent Clp protease ATP-binding subunit ClpB
MSEYMEAHSVARLFGSPPGYVGHDEGGQLTEAIKRNPYSIILFDEIEKAHKRVFDALLQILDAGRMTDGEGEVVDFKNTIIIMTSNIGSEIIREGLENNYDPDVIESALFEEIKKHFRPEFLNRFDAKVMFNSLTPEIVEKIAETELKKLAEKLSEENEYEIYWHPDVPAFITQERYSIVDGARPIKRYIDETIINQLTDKTLNREIIPGDIVYIRVENDELILIPMDEETLKEVQKEEKKTLESLKVLKKSHGSKITMAQKEPKKKKKKKKKGDWKSNTFKLDTKIGD